MTISEIKFYYVARNIDAKYELMVIIIKPPVTKKNEKLKDEATSSFQLVATAPISTMKTMMKSGTILITEKIR